MLVGATLFSPDKRFDSIDSGVSVKVILVKHHHHFHNSGLAVGVVEGSGAASYVREHWDKSIKIIDFENEMHLMKALQSGEIEAAFMRKKDYQILSKEFPLSNVELLKSIDPPRVSRVILFPKGSKLKTKLEENLKLINIHEETPVILDLPEKEVQDCNEILSSVHENLSDENKEPQEKHEINVTKNLVEADVSEKKCLNCNGVLCDNHKTNLMESKIEPKLMESNVSNGDSTLFYSAISHLEEGSKENEGVLPKNIEPIALEEEKSEKNVIKKPEINVPMSSNPEEMSADKKSGKKNEKNSEKNAEEENDFFEDIQKKIDMGFLGTN